MQNIIAFSIWLAVIYPLAPSMRRNPRLFYALIAAVSATALLFSSFPLSAIVNDGYAALSLWIIVMFAGIPNPLKRLSKRVRLVRTQLSIAAFMLTMGHFIHDFEISLHLPILTGLLSLLIMVPLFATSFSFVRKRFDGMQWKKLHRWSYAAYMLMLAHVILITENPGHLSIYSLVLFMYVYFKFKGSNPALGAGKLLLLAILLLNLGISLVHNTQPSGTEEPDGALADIAIEGSVFADGTYEGAADGYGPGLRVEVRLKDNQIVEITIVDHNERGESYYMPAFESIPRKIIESQSVAVDAVSGSTYSSYGIMKATNDALGKALVSGELEEPVAAKDHGGDGRRHKNRQKE